MHAPAAPELARHLADILEAADIPYAIGGALALAIWGFPRATNDVDLDIFLEPEALLPTLDVLQRGGFTVEREAALESARTRGDFKLWKHGMRVDVFVAAIPFYESVRQRIKQAPLEGRPAWFLSPEDLVIFKMLFFRTKDILDVERLVAFLGGSFDRGHVHRWLIDLVGPTDSRIRRWEQICQDVGA